MHEPPEALPFFGGSLVVLAVLAVPVVPVQLVRLAHGLYIAVVRGVPILVYTLLALAEVAVLGIMVADQQLAKKVAQVING